MNRSSEQPVVFAKFLDDDILSEYGRLLFSLLNAFASSGYAIKLHDNLQQKNLGKYGQLALSLNQLTLTDAIPGNTETVIYLFDQEDKAAGKYHWRKKIQVRFDIFSAYWLGEPILMPYPIHPVHTGPDLHERLEKCRSSTRKLRIFFSGDSEGYTKNRIRYPGEKLPRLEIINAILHGMRPETLAVLRDEERLHGLLTSGYSNKFILTEQFRIHDKHWLDIIAQSDFFLCPPGYVMPMCHNAIEAMAVGSIPIINYPEWFSPHLTDMENCIVFSDKISLIDKLETVLAMDEGQIAAMRAEVLHYYESHLLPSSFVRRIESIQRQKQVVLMITDANVVRNSSRLGRHSFLVRGNANMSKGHWLNKLRAIKV